jgi:glycosyltransferase involved in cell wall biosynthesis
VPLVAIDARKYFDYGIGTYLRYLIREMSMVQTRFDGLLYIAATDVGKITLNKNWRTLPVPFKKYSLGELVRFSPRVRNDGAALFHEPHYTLPLNLPVPAIVTIHDLIHLQVPHYFSPVQKMYAHWLIGYAVRRADAIITTTEFTKRELLDRYPAAAEKIHVIPLAAGDEFKPVEDRPALELFKRKNGLGKPYLLYTGSLKPHKNIPLLLKAYAMAQCRGWVDIVFTGERIAGNPECAQLRRDLGIDAALHDLGKLSTSDLVLAIAAAETVILPSEYEGFGLPVIEAMACGTPVIISDASALIEVAGGAAFSFERKNADALSATIDQVISDTVARDRCRIQGLSRSRQFSWGETARKTLTVYDAFV